MAISEWLDKSKPESRAFDTFTRSYGKPSVHLVNRAQVPFELSPDKNKMRETDESSHALDTV